LPSPPADDEVVRRVLAHQVWAVVGCAPDPERPSNEVAQFLLDHGRTVIPVNPVCDEILGQPCFATLAAIPDDLVVDVVDCFRRSEFVGSVVSAAFARGVRAVWMQPGVVDADATARAEAVGIDVVVGRSPEVEWRRLGLS
jgi:predicted CoA-binding protein